MRKEARAVLRREMDVRQRLFRMASGQKGSHGPWLRDVRQALGVSMVGMARKLQVTRAAISGVEEREREMNVSLKTLSRVAQAMGCELVYAVVPQRGTLAEMAELEALRKRLESKAGMRCERKPRVTRKAETSIAVAELAEVGEPTDSGKMTPKEDKYMELLRTVEDKGPDKKYENLRRRIMNKLDALRRKRLGEPSEASEADKWEAKIWADFERRKGEKGDQGSGVREQGTGNRDQGSGVRD
jgi:transcriptional regulator with XRE-family HTH domain